MATRSIMALLAVSTVLTACASGTVQDLNARDWVGHREDHLVATWGPPHHSYTMVAGGKMIGYQFSERRVIWRPRGQSVASIKNCMVNFETDRNGVILDAVAIGTTCRIGPHDQMHPPKTN